MEIAKIIYKGNLRTEATHLKSGQTVISDAPVDNNGKGEAFSPTDLLSTSLGMCMLTIMGIAAQKHEIGIGNVEVAIGKHMGTDPRRVVKIDVTLTIEDLGLGEKQRKILENAALTCPVAKSLSPEIIQNVAFKYVKG
ncbi:MAG TPA: OsmC family protein [Flavobacteriales bacterium]|nr:OsmC family protein [Flavobacteriales bacterium]